MVSTFSYAAIPTDSIGEGTTVGYIPLPVDTVKDTSFHAGDTLFLPDGEIIVKPFESKREEVAIPSVKTDVKIIAGDGFAHGTVEQTFYNPFDLPFEATYIFPLPHNGAVHAMDFRTSTGVYHAEIMEKEEAKEQYEQAKQEGKQASLLMQGQDNIFIQKLCNIMPHDSVSVTISFSMTLEYDMGVYELAFPTVVGPRFDPASLPKRLSNPIYIPPDTRSGSSLDFSILLLTPYPVDDIECASHEVTKEDRNVQGALRKLGILGPWQMLPPNTYPSLIRLVAKSTIPNKDIVVRFKRKDTGRDISLLTWNDGTEGYFAMNIFPDLINTAHEEDKAIDMVFVLDVSGSMSGEPIAKLKEIMNAMLDRARPIDRLSFIAFSSSTTNFHEEPVEATAENIAEAREWINNLGAGGGTQILAGVQKGLSVPLEPGRLRIMSLITDGYIGGVDDIYEAIKNDSNATIAFTFGVGSSPNRELIDCAAKAGNGMARNILLSDDVEEIIAEFWTRIRAPQITDISIDWGGYVYDLTIDEFSNLWIGQPIKVFGKYKNGGWRTITLTGNKDGEPITETYHVFFVYRNTFISSVPKMWARETIENLRNEQVAAGNEFNKDAILAISLEHEVLCQYTAFLAVADSFVNENGEMIAMEVPVYVPGGIDPYMAGAEFLDIKAGVIGNMSINPSVELYSSPADTNLYIIVVDPSETIEKGVVELKQIPQLFFVKHVNSIKFSLQNVSQTCIDDKICIFDLRGRVVMSWTLAELAENNYVWNWDYTNINGQRISKGAYTMVAYLISSRIVELLIY